MFQDLRSLYKNQLYLHPLAHSKRNSSECKIHTLKTKNITEKNKAFSRHFICTECQDNAVSDKTSQTYLLIQCKSYQTVVASFITSNWLLNFILIFKAKIIWPKDKKKKDDFCILISIVPQIIKWEQCGIVMKKNTYICGTKIGHSDICGN